MSRGTLVLIFVLATLGPSLVIAIIGAASIKALARNPAAAAKIQTTMALAFFLAAAIAVVALLVLFHVFTSG